MKDSSEELPEEDPKKEFGLGANPNLQNASLITYQIPTLTPAQNQFYKGLFDEVKVEFEDQKILRDNNQINIASYVFSALWILFSFAFIYWFIKLNDLSDPTKFTSISKEVFTLLILQKIGFAALGLTLIISLYKLSRFLYAQAITYRYNYLDAKLKINLFLAIIRFGAGFSEKFLEKFLSEKKHSYDDSSINTMPENLSKNLSDLLGKAIDKLGKK